MSIRQTLILILFLTGAAFSQTTVNQSAFGFQCGQQAPNCTNAVYPSQGANMGTLRVWDMSWAWGEIDKSTGYDWTLVNTWLDVIYAHMVSPSTNLKIVWYTFGETPCFRTAGTNCNSRGSPDPPLDLTGSGSPSFNNFVTAFVQHCNANSRCVKDLIKYYGTWNEANAAAFWNAPAATSQLNLYQLIKPAWAIIQANVTGAHLGTPEISAGTGFQAWIQAYLAIEVANGIISTDYAFHRYWRSQIPEATLSGTAQQICPNSGITFGCAVVAGWSTLPVWDTELGFASGTYVCNSATYTPADCAGQVARWQILAQSNGIQGIFWYKWMLIIGTVPANLTDYSNVQTLTTGGTYPSACTSSGTPVIYQCAFTEADTTTSLWVWTTSPTASFTVPGNYTDFRDLHGGRTYVQPSQSISVTQEPILLELSPLPFPPSTPATFID